MSITETETQKKFYFLRKATSCQVIIAVMSHHLRLCLLLLTAAAALLSPQTRQAARLVHTLLSCALG
jgi:hypothetical protein